MRRLLLLVVLLGLTSQARAAETLSQLITDVRVLTLDASSSSRQKFTDAQITNLLNQAQHEMAAADGCMAQSLQFNLVPGSTYYPLPANFTVIDRVTIGNKWLQEMSMAALDGRSRGWESSSGYPTYYFMDISSRGVMGFAPWPATSSDTDTVKVEYEIQPNDMVNSTDVPFNGINEFGNFHHALAYWAAMTISNIVNQKDRAALYQSLFTAVTQQFVKQCRANPNYRPSATGTP